MIKQLCIVVLLFSCFLIQPSSLSHEVVNINMRNDIVKTTRLLFTDQSLLDVKNFSHPDCRRNNVEFVLGQQAMHLGGSKITFHFPVNNAGTRNIRLVEKGLALLSFDTVWHSRAQKHKDSVYISEPMIKKGEYFAGIYTAKVNVEKLKLDSLMDLRALSIVSNKNWPVDWQTLAFISPKKLVHEAEWFVMAKLVSRQWVDVMLAPFTHEPPFKYEGTDYSVFAVPNVKILLPESRHFIVSKLHPLGQQAFQALQKGLKILRSEGRIRKAYRECGFFNSHTQGWTVLNPLSEAY